MNDICISIKSKKTPTIRCKCLKKKNLDYCGRHFKSKNKIIFKKPPSNAEIIKVQSYIRMFNVLNRKKCVNECDFFTCDSSFETPSQFFFKTSNNYFFDIRSLHKLYTQTHKHTNPYTLQQLTNIENTKYRRHICYILKSKYNIYYNEIKFSPNIEYNNKLVSVFQKFDLLDHYTDTKWFESLSLDNLKKLYLEAEDIWNYRTQMNLYHKKQIVPEGIAFQYHYYIIRGFNESDKYKLKNIILDEFDKFVSYSHNINNKKLGAMLMMTALVSVSPDAAMAMPHYVQNFY
jgi:hypothetical protein